MSKNAQKIKSKSRKLSDLRSVGPATVADLRLLGIHHVEQLVGQNADALYEELCNRTGSRHDPCCIDVFRAAVEQVNNPNLEARKCNWWYWTKVRKQQLK